MKWLTLSLENFESTPDISFSIKKPLLAASVVLRYENRTDALYASAEARAKVPLKSALHYIVEATSKRREFGTFSFSRIEERDETGRQERVSTTEGSTLTIAKKGQEPRATEIRNESPVPILAHLFVLPAFQQSRESQTRTYAGHVAIGARLQAVRIERRPPRDKRIGAVETYELKFVSVLHAVNEEAWLALPWDAKSGYEFDWDIAGRSIAAARFRLPIFGELEIRS